MGHGGESHVRQQRQRNVELRVAQVAAGELGRRFQGALGVAHAVVLLVASIPIAMQVVCTSTMAVGAHKLAQRKALVCRLTAIEELSARRPTCTAWTPGPGQKR